MGKPFLHVFIENKCFKIFSRISRPISIKIDTRLPCIKRIYMYVCSNKGLNPLSRGDNHKNAKIGRVHLKIVFSRITEPKNLRFTRKFSEILSNHGCGGIIWGHNMENHFYINSYWKKIFFFKTSRLISIKIEANYPCMKEIHSFFFK
jgi:hypothetical protein